MKRAVIVLTAGLLAAVVAYCCVYSFSTASHRKLLASKAPELLWLKNQFHLSDAEFARISELHAAYLPQCRERCRRIEEQSDKLKSLLASVATMTPEIEGILVERAKMQAECQAEMLKHFFEVSRTMPPEQGRRYLAWVQEQTCLREHGMEAQHHANDEPRE
jgi:hypothetical protein